MNFDLSLRVKLVLIIGVIVSFSTMPLIWLGYKDTYERSVATAEDQFQRISRIVDEGIQLSYLNVQTFVIDKTAIEKDDIRSELDFLEEIILTGKLDESMDVLEFMRDKWLTYCGVIDSEGKFLFPSPLLESIFRENIRDYLRTPVRAYLDPSDRNFSRDYYTFFRADTDAGKNMPILMALRKSNNLTVIVAQTVNYLEDALPEKMSVLEAHLRDVVKTLNLPKGSVVGVTDADGSLIAGRGEVSFTGRRELFPELFDEAREKGSATGIVTVADKEYLFAIRHFKPLDWFVQTSMPMDVIAGPAKAKAVRLSVIAAAIFILISSLGLWFITWMLQPLRRLAHCARRLEVFDFITGDVAARLQGITQELPRQSRDEVGQVSSAFSSMIVAMEKNIEALKKSVARQHSIEGELNAAREIQRGMLPPAGDDFRSRCFIAGAVMEAAKEVGGDFYDVLETPDGRRAVVIGDVSGKGVSAALFMSVTLTLIRNAVSESLTPAEVMKKVNDQLALNNPSCMFVTLWIGYFDPLTGALDYANGGHCPPAVVPTDPSKPVRWMSEVSGPLVGALDMAEFTDLSDTLDEGDLCLIYTDGVSEAMNEKRELFGDKRIEAVMKEHHGSCPDTLIAGMMKAIVAHRGRAEQSDDITMVVFRRLGADSAPKE